jgi:TATA-box binding protein (TBP) (component of TFIID and TFIIIB)
MEFVCNANYKGDLHQSIDLIKLSQKLPNSKFHHKPCQLVVKDTKGTVIFFNNGKFRVMGCIDELDASFLVFDYIIKINKNSIDFPSIQLQTFTSRAQLGFRINLSKLAAAAASSSSTVIYEPELFPAVRICKYNPASVNVFSTGSILVCGLKAPDEMLDILNYLREHCQPYKL